MYVLESCQTDISKILTTSEVLWDRMNHNRMLEMISNPLVKVVRCDRSSNFYGEWLFLNLVYDDKYILSSYSMGYHDQRETYIYDYWKLTNFDTYDKKSHHSSFQLDKEEVFKMISENYHEYKNLDKNDQISYSAEVFNLLADFGDEDGAMSMMESFDYLINEVE